MHLFLSLGTLGQYWSHVLFQQAFSLCAFPLCCFSPWRPSSLIQHALRISVTFLARSLGTMRLCAVSPGFWFYLTLWNFPRTAVTFLWPPGTAALEPWHSDWHNEDLETTLGCQLSQHMLDGSCIWATPAKNKSYSTEANGRLPRVIAH